MNITKMKNRINNVVSRAIIIILILMIVLSAGCIKSAKKWIGGNTSEEVSQESVFPDRESTPVNIGDTISPETIQDTTPIQTESFIVEEVNPEPYFTPDPYQIPYRDHGNWTTIDANRVPKIPQFTRSFSLHSNATAIRVNVTRAPLVIDLTFSPYFENPDQTGDTDRSYPSDDEGGSDGEDNVEGGSWKLSGTFAFVYPYAEISVIDAITNGTVAREGFGGIYSSDKKKKITLYREGSYIVTLTGDFIDISMAITTGDGADKTPVTQAATSPSAGEEEDW